MNVKLEWTSPKIKREIQKDREKRWDGAKAINKGKEGKIKRGSKRELSIGLLIKEEERK